MLRLPIRRTRPRALAAAMAIVLLPVGVTFVTATTAPAAQLVSPPRPQGPGQPDAGAPGMSPLGSALLPAVCGLCLAAQYLFIINYAAPRFLLPAYALLAIPAADGLAFLVTRTGMNLRPAMTAVVVGAAWMLRRVDGSR